MFALWWRENADRSHKSSNLLPHQKKGWMNEHGVERVGERWYSSCLRTVAITWTSPDPAQSYFARIFCLSSSATKNKKTMNRNVVAHDSSVAVRDPHDCFERAAFFSRLITFHFHIYLSSIEKPFQIMCVCVWVGRVCSSVLFLWMNECAL